MGRTPLDAETKAANRRATLQRYAQRNRETLREAARARMQRYKPLLSWLSRRLDMTAGSVRAQEKSTEESVLESRSRARAWAAQYRESHRDEIRAANAARQGSVHDAKKKNAASPKKAKKKTTAPSAKRTTTAPSAKRTTKPKKAIHSPPPRPAPANAGYLIPFTDPSFLHNKHKGPVPRAPRPRQRAPSPPQIIPPGLRPPRPSKRAPAPPQITPPANTGYLIPFTDPSFLHNKTPAPRTPRSRTATSTPIATHNPARETDVGPRFAWPGRLLPYDANAVVTANQKRCRALRRCGLEEDNGEDSDADLPPGMCGCENPTCRRLHKNESKKRREWKGLA
ncbi:hypothetical protein B0H16DRAFT_1472470 [Mycena metata]|uniref:Uncharacterized protein n=1 Tax=Mycena metata TaxID=1033252 RepID=A0AAD7HNY1_9AGAR|nr:hypothetical protein B0H16DRAFT_1472470 [Mycena metata]